jgi:saccharopine dehydrogenase-like NADP-dependent oxidoreductase
MSGIWIGPTHFNYCTGKSVLVLGAGLCPPPLVKYLGENGFRVILASRTLDAANKLINGVKNAEAKGDQIRYDCLYLKALDIETPEGVKLLEELVPQVDAVICFVKTRLNIF